jgi:octaprenyl-diphosphate synthase
MAFQLIDDMLDFVSREATLGKPVGGDLKEGKVTLPLVYALETATGRRTRHGGNRAARPQLRRSVPFADVRLAMVERHGGIQRTRERAAAVHRPRPADCRPSSPRAQGYQRALCTLTDLLVTERDR